MSRQSKIPWRVSQIFFSRKERRLRAGWRLLGQFLLLRALVHLIRRITAPLFDLPLSDHSLLLLGELFWISIVTLSIYLARRYLDRRSFISLGLRWNRQAWMDLLFGFGLGALSIALIFGMEWAAGLLQVTGFAWEKQSWSEILSPVLLEFIVYGVSTSWTEELSDRGYLLQNLKDGLNLPLAMVLSSGLFAFGHWWNPNSGLFSTLGLFASGLFFAYAWVRTGQLWLPMGLHAGWNFFEGTVLGFPLSGLETFHLIHQTVSGPEWITGGAFGPEGGAVVVSDILVSTLGIYGWTQGRFSRHCSNG